MIFTFESLPQQVATLTEEVRVLKRMLTEFTTTPVNHSETITIDEVCSLTGYKRNTIYQLVHRGHIPYHKPKHGGRKLIFLRAEILQWAKAKKTESVSDYCSRKEGELSNRYKGGLE